MSCIRCLRWSVGAFLLLAILALVERPDPADARAPAVKAPVVRKEIGKNVVLEIEGKERRVIVNANVVLREGLLEGLLTRTMAKEHEYILATDSDARHIHTALLVAGGKPGSPVVFHPNYVPAHGSSIKISLRYKKDGKTVTVPAGDWVREAKSKKALAQNWVFAGSRLIHSEGKDRPPLYAANHGDVICLCNMDTALLDLPLKSLKTFDSRTYEANTDRIPAKDTPVEILLEPIAAKDMKDKK